MLVTATGIENLTAAAPKIGRRRRSRLPALIAHAGVRRARRGGPRCCTTSPSSARARSARRWRWRLPTRDLDVVVLDARARGRDAARRSLARAVARRAAHLRAPRRLGRRSRRRAAPSRRSPRIDISQAGGFGADRALPRTSTDCRRWATSSAIARCRRRSMRRSRAPASRVRHGVDGRRPSAARPAYAAVDVRRRGERADARAPRRGRRRHRRGGRRHRAAAPRLRAGRARRQSVARDAARRTRVRALHADGPDGAAARGRSLRARLDGDAGARARICSRWTMPHSWPSSRAISAPRAGGFTRVADRRTFPLALEFARDRSARAASCSAMRRKRCIRSRGRDSMSACATRGSSRRSSSTRRATRSAMRAMLARYARAPAHRPARGHRVHARSRQPVRQRRCRSCAGRAGWRSLCSTRCRRRSARSRARCCSDCAESRSERSVAARDSSQKACHVRATDVDRLKSRAHRRSRVPRNGYNPLPRRNLPSDFRSLCSCASVPTSSRTTWSSRRWRA